MKLRDFKIGWRLLVKDPGYSAVVIFGLALGIAVCFLLTALVTYAFSFYAHVPDRERIYLVKHRNVLYGMGNNWSPYSPLVIRDVIKNSGMTVTATGARELSVSVHTDLAEQKEKFVLVDPSFPEIFGIKALEGDLHAALTQANYVALTPGMAEKLFGTIHAVGKTLGVGQQSLQVAAILKDAPDNATTKYQILAGLNSSVWRDKDRENTLTHWGYSSGRNYLKLAPNMKLETVRKLLQDSADRAPDSELSSEQEIQFGVKHATQIKLVSLNDVYFDADLNNDASLANRPAMFGLLAVAVLILFLAANNYVNLAAVRTLRRQREIAIRKALGASKAQIVSQFVCESLLVALFACALGLLIAWLALPTFSNLVGLELSDTIAPAAYLTAGAIAIVLGLLTAAYPAYLALQVDPGSALAGRAENEHYSGLWTRRALTVFQFSCALGLTSVCLFIAWQTYYASTVNPGYDTRGLLILDTPFETSDEVKQIVIEQLERIPKVLAVSNALDGFGTWSSTTGNFNAAGKEPVNLDYTSVTPNFFKVYGVAAAAGRVFDAKIDQQKNSRFVVINAAASLTLGFSTPQAAVGQFLEFGDGNRQIIGIAPDLRHRTIRQKPVPMVYLIGKPDMGVAIRVRGELNDTQAEIETVWKRHFPKDPIRLHTASSVFSEKYRNDISLVQLLAAASVVASAIAALGIYVLSAYNVQRRAREIVLRKLYGASQAAIARLLGYEFFILIFISALASLPLAWLVCQRYLAGFVEQAPYINWSLAFALLLSCTLALLASLRHSMAAMRMAPAAALRG